jgi:hypothetical protein
MTDPVIYELCIIFVCTYLVTYCVNEWISKKLNK